MKISVLCVALASMASAQVPQSPEIPSAITALFDAPAKDSLHCSFRRSNTFLDFAFRYNAGYWVRTPLAQFPTAEALTSYVRVSPQGGQPLVLRDSFEIAAVAPEVVRHLGPKDLKKIDV